MSIGLWILTHALSMLYISRKYLLVVFLIIFLALLVYILKNDTYDLHWYKAYFSSMSNYREPLFDAYSIFLYKALGSSSLVVWAYFASYSAVVLFIFYYMFEKESYPRKYNRFNYIVALSLAWGSVFFVLTTQNAIRQGMALLFIFLAVLLWNRNKKVISLVFVFIGMGFHWSAPGTFLIAMLCYTASHSSFFNVSPRKYLGGYVSSSGVKLKHIILFFLGFLIALALMQVMQGLYTTDSEFSGARSSSWVKAIAISVVFFISDFLIGKYYSTEKFCIREYRQSIFYLVMGFSILPEGFARVLYFYYTVEMFFLLWAINQKNNRIKGSALVVLLAYMVAPNVLNIIGG